MILGWGPIYLVFVNIHPGAPIVYAYYMGPFLWLTTPHFGSWWSIATVKSYNLFCMIKRVHLSTPFCFGWTITGFFIVHFWQELSLVFSGMFSLVHTAQPKKRILTKEKSIFGRRAVSPNEPTLPEVPSHSSSFLYSGGRLRNGWLGWVPITPTEWRPKRRLSWLRSSFTSRILTKEFCWGRDGRGCYIHTHYYTRHLIGVRGGSTNSTILFSSISLVMIGEIRLLKGNFHWVTRPDAQK